MDEHVEVPLPTAASPVCFQIPRNLLGEVATPVGTDTNPDVSGKIRQALDRPVDSPCLNRMLKPGQRVALIVDDVSRPTPVKRILPSVIEEFSKAGVEDMDVVVVVALGSHRPMTKEEISFKIGKKAASRFRVVNVSCDDFGHFSDLGKTANNIKALILKKVADADVKIGVGAIFPHMDAGFSGGAKIILPGVAARETVDGFHAFSPVTRTNHLGNPDAPSRKTLEDFVMETKCLDFIINVVLDMGNRVVHCVAGHPIHAHRAGVEHARRIYGIQVKKRYPLVIANSFPMEIDFWQCTKAIWAGEMMTLDNGLLVLVSPCTEGTATHPMFSNLLEKTTGELFHLLEKGGTKDPTALAFAAMMSQIRDRVRLAIVSPGISFEQAHKMGMKKFESVERAIESESVRLNHGDLGVLTHGGITFPVLQ